MFPFPWNRNKKPAQPVQSPPPPAREEPPPEEPDTAPDCPIPFGYKTGWLCVQSGDPAAVIAALGLRNAAPCSWKSGLDQVSWQGKIFVSPALDGWVLAVGFLAEDLAAPFALAQKFPRVLYFASHRVSNYAAWARFEGGKLLRAYACAGDEGVFWDEGELTPEEISLGGDRFPRRGQEIDWDEAEFPDEETVIALSAAWGVDTSFSGKEYPPALGWVCGGRR